MSGGPSTTDRAQRALFAPDELPGLDPPSAPGSARRRAALRPSDNPVEPMVPDAEVSTLAQDLGRELRLGTSSWHFPGWQGLVWAGPHASQVLSRHGLGAYAAHPLLRCVSLDRAFYRTLDADTYAGLAAQVPADFRFVVKAPATLSDAVLRQAGTGAARGPNPGFLDPDTAARAVMEPALRGLGDKLGVLVLQLSALPAQWLEDRRRLHAALARCLAALAGVPGRPAGTHLAVEVRDPSLLDARFSDMLREAGALFVLGLHDRMPPVSAQLEMLRAQWPAPLVCRWNLQRGLRYEDARRRFAPFDRLQAPDSTTREVVARVAGATAAAGHPVFVTINNKAEGSAPLSVRALAEAIAAQRRSDRAPASAAAQ